MNSILVIGNASAIQGRNMGAVIDAFPRVMRFNDFASGEKYASDYGTRTTHHAFSWEMRAHAMPDCKRIVSTAAHHYANRPDMQAKTLALPVGAAQVVPLEFVVESAIDAGIVWPKFPSTGLVTVRWLIANGYAPTLLNFDGFATGHYYDGPTGNATDQAAHHWDAETRFFKELEASGEISIYRS